MLVVQSGSAGVNCLGVTRRTALKAGLLGLTGLTLSDFFRLQAAQPTTGSGEKSVILIWLDGGPSHLETFDPKPEAPEEYRGPFGVCKTSIPGVCVSELMPGVAQRIRQVALLRSLHHDNGDHFAAAHWMTTGRFGSTSVNLPQKYPSIGSYVARIQGSRRAGLPPYVGLPSAETVYLFPGYMGPAYLGGAYGPFDVDRDNKYLGATDTRPIRSPQWLRHLTAAGDAQTIVEERGGLLRTFDTLRRDIDQSGVMQAMDQFQQQALDLILGSAARTAFDIDKEPVRLAERYGANAWGRYTLMARRLVEAGVRFVTVDMPHWDDHSSLQRGHGTKVPVVDRAVSALLDDLETRGLLSQVLVIVMGEFGRTPRINKGLPNDPVPGRDHWGQAISVLLAGGGIPGGVVVGATNARGEHPVQRAVTPQQLHATIYHHLGIDPSLTFKDHTGRPIPILDDPTPIRELI
ncbi:MAG: DUF1501 domain-containing protein [Gemmataceae bacterium]|nr:DUF1501 domain-containing protein [Gemmataceae bacterium]MCS7269582.1 DUF1501 domain-containing protein [Gemmataceae bacterium]MDW8244005.1 DUF1501 domain-containing protein [Thermogemmata sp.]